MDKARKNKMITTNEEVTKTAPLAERKLGKQIQTFYFPHQGKSIEAESLEEAEKIIKNQIKK